MCSSDLRRAVDMRIWHFGRVHVDGDRNWGDWALHVSCPWRLGGPRGPITGRGDLWTPSDPAVDVAAGWDCDSVGNLQDHRLGRLFGQPPGKSGYVRTLSPTLTVASVSVDVFATLTITFTDAFQLTAFPDSTVHESWRVFSPNDDRPHLVVVGTSLEPPSSEGRDE